MGCADSKISSEDLIQEAERRWMTFPTMEEVQTQFTAEGIISDTDADGANNQLEFRSLLEHKIAQDYMHAYCHHISPQLEQGITSLIQIRAYKMTCMSRPACALNNIEASRVFDLYIKKCDLVNSQTISNVQSLVSEDMDGATGMTFSPNKKSLLQTNSLQMQTPTQRSQSDCQTLTQSEIQTHQTDFSSVFDELYAELFRVLYNDMFVKYKQTESYSEMNIKLRQRYNNVHPDDFEYLGVLGKGGFGLVCDVRKKSTGRSYAMKIQSKQMVFAAAGREPHRASLEMQVCADCKHPFIAELCFAFQTPSLVLLVMDLGTGWDLSLLIETLGCLEYINVHYYAAEITSALSYLHHKGYLYRDLKPANVLLNLDGHIQLIDFGAVKDLTGRKTPVSPVINSYCTTQKELGYHLTTYIQNTFHPPDGTQYSNGTGVLHEEFTEFASFCGNASVSASATVTASASAAISKQRTKSIVGTAGYMAPEISYAHGETDRVTEGYTAAVDWWSLGVTVYRLLIGTYPFSLEGDNNDCATVTNNSLRATEIDFSSLEGNDDYANGIDFISRLLDPDDTNRMGYGDTGTVDVASHPYFKNIDWQKLENKKIPPPPLPCDVEDVETLAGAKAYNSLEHFVTDNRKGSWLKFGQAKPPSPMVETEASVQKHFLGWNYASSDSIALELSRYASNSGRQTGNTSGRQTELSVSDANFRVRDADRLLSF